MLDKDYQDYKHKNFPATVKESRLPGQTVQWYGKDQQEKDTTPEPVTLHLTQSRDWSNVDIDYTWNSMGYRGPEPNKHAERKILLAGGSQLLGVGLPLDFTLAETLAGHYQADYLNMSDYDSLTELTEPLQTLGVDYDPDYVIIGDTRMVVENNWLMAFIKTKLKSHGLELTKQDLQFFQETFNRTNRDVLNIFSEFVANLFPRSKICFLIFPRKNFKFETGLLNQVTVTRDMITDLSRDNSHPGPDTVETIADAIIRKLDE